MLDCKRDRIDYGEQLQPPAGYRLDRAVAATYSADLGALLSIPVALVYAQTLEGDLTGSRFQLLEAIKQFSGRVRVYHQAGQLHVPTKLNWLYAHLEEVLAPILPDARVMGGKVSLCERKIELRLPGGFVLGCKQSPRLGFVSRPEALLLSGFGIQGVENAAVLSEPVSIFHVCQSWGYDDRPPPKAYGSSLGVGSNPPKSRQKRRLLLQLVLHSALSGFTGSQKRCEQAT